MKKEYVKPCIRLEEMAFEPFLGESTETLPFDPNDGTDEALSKEDKSWGSVWDE